MITNIEKSLSKIRKMPFRRNLAIIGIFILFILPSFLFINTISTNTNETVPKAVQATNNYSFNHMLFSNQKLTAGSTISTPTISPLHPTPQNSVTVSTFISDSNGVKNASIFWRYTDTSISALLFNSTMSPSSTDYVNTNSGSWNTTGYLNTTTGTILSSGTSNLLYGIYSFQPNNGFSFDSFSMSVSRSGGGGGGNSITYYELYGFNISTSSWILYKTYNDQFGGSNTNTSTSGHSSFTIGTTNSTTAYKVFIVAYRNFGVSAPNINSIVIARSSYSGVITTAPTPATNVPTHVTYSIRTFNNLNLVTNSGNYTFLMDNKPTVSFYQMSNSVLGINNFVLKVAVQDLDGFTNIANSSVKGKFYTDNPNQYTMITLTFANLSSSTTSIFSAQIDLSHVKSLSNTITFSVNASDTLGLNATFTKTFLFDINGPSMTGYVFNTSLDYNPGTKYYVYNISTIPELNVTMTDPSGVQDVTLYYSYNGGSFQSVAMTNTTLNNETITTQVFNATLPTSTTSAKVNWYLLSHDFGNNANVTPVLSFYFDGDAPVLVQQIFNPPYVSNTTSPYLLFNVTDVDGAYTPIFYYSYNYMLSWTQAHVSPINYNNFAINSTNYGYPTKFLPWQIPQNQIANISQRIIFPYTVDQAILTFSLTFTQGAYLRIWIENDLGTKALVFDRVSGYFNKTVFNIDITKLGFSTKDFYNSTFALVCESYSNIYYGNINQFSIKVSDYSIPLGYQYIVKLPASNNDTTGYYFFNLKDHLNHQTNTTIFTYYIDGTMPSVNVTSPTTLQSSIDLNKASHFNVTFNSFDKGGIFLVELYYMINNDTAYNWIIVSNYVNITSGSLNFQIPMSSVNGTLYFKIRVFDHVGFASATPVYKVDYTNATIASENTSTTKPSSTNGFLGLLVPLLLIGGAVVIVGGGLYFTVPKLRKSKKLTAVKNKISSKRPPSS